MTTHEPHLLLQSAPFLRRGLTTPKLMVEVLLALLPVILAAVYFFGFSAVLVLGAATIGAVGTEWLLSRPRGASRLPAPMLMGLGVAMLETKQMRTSMQLGRARAVSDARAISNQRRTMRPPVVPHSRGRSASTLT